MRCVVNYIVKSLSLAFMFFIVQTMKIFVDTCELTVFTIECNLKYDD